MAKDTKKSKDMKEDKKQAVKAEGIEEEQAPEGTFMVEDEGIELKGNQVIRNTSEGPQVITKDLRKAMVESVIHTAKTQGLEAAGLADPQEDKARELRVRARTVKQLPMAYKLDENVVKAFRSYVLRKYGSQLGAGLLLEEILREYLPAHGFPIGSDGGNHAN